MNSQVAQLFSDLDQHRRQYSPAGSAQCDCLKERAALDRSYYATLRGLIEGALQEMHNPQDDVAKLLREMVGYVATILDLQSRQTLCACKIRTLGQVASLQHTVDFLRKENAKLFSMYEEKEQELQKVGNILKGY